MPVIPIEFSHSQISVLPVVENVEDINARCLGLVRLHDLYQTDLL